MINANRGVKCLALYNLCRSGDRCEESAATSYMYSDLSRAYCSVCLALLVLTALVPLSRKESNDQGQIRDSALAPSVGKVRHGLWAAPSYRYSYLLFV